MTDFDHGIDNQVLIMNRSIISGIATAFVLTAGVAIAQAHETSQAKLQAEAKILEPAARATALAKVPNGTISSAELEKEHGKLVWSFDIAQAGSKDVTEIQVSAKTGKIVSTKIETPQKEAKEAAAEAKEAVKK